MSPTSGYRYKPSLGRPRRMMERQNFTIYEDETATTPIARSPTDPESDPALPNAKSNTNAKTIPESPANMEQPNPNQNEETPNAETVPSTQTGIENTVDNNVPVTPSTSAAIGLEHMILASRRQPVASEAEDFSRLENIAEEIDEAMSLSPANRSGLPDIPRADEISAEGPGAETLSIRIPARGLSPQLVQTPTRLMPPHQTSASRVSRSRPAQSPAARLLRSARPSQRLIVRSTGTQDDDEARPSVVRNLFSRHTTKLVSTPPPNRNASEPRVFRPQTGHELLRPSRLRSVSLTSSLNEDTEMASPSMVIPELPTRQTHVITPRGQTGETPVITPESQTGGSPPTPPTPHTPNAWVSPSQVTPNLAARMFVPPVYRNRDEPMEMTPSPPDVKPASPNDNDMEDAFWTPSKARASLHVAGLQKKVTAAQNPGLMQYEAPLADAMAKGFAPTQNIAPIRNLSPVEDAMSPGTTTVRLVVSTEIITTIPKTPSPQRSPIPARRPTDNLRRSAATTHQATNAPSRHVASTPQRTERGGAEQRTNQRRNEDQVITGGINRRQELRNTPRYSFRDSTRSILPGTYSLTPVQNRPVEAESASKKK